MKRLCSIIALSVLTASGALHAGTFEYNYGLRGSKTSVSPPPAQSEWVAATPLYGDWANSNSLYGCSNWSPSAASKEDATLWLSQSATDCTADQTRTRQDREENKSTGEIRNKGEPTTETQQITGQSSLRTYVIQVAWADVGPQYDCTWSPLASDYPVGEQFSQTGTGCKLNQTASRQEFYQDPVTTEWVTVSSTQVNRTLTGQRSYRAITGTNEFFVSSLSPSPSVISGGATSTVTAVVMGTNGKLAQENSQSVYFTTSQGWLSEDNVAVGANGQASTVLNCSGCSGDITVTAVSQNGVEASTTIRAVP
jgi:hypothetical protein